MGRLSPENPSFYITFADSLRCAIVCKPAHRYRKQPNQTHSPAAFRATSRPALSAPRRMLTPFKHDTRLPFTPITMASHEAVIRSCGRFQVNVCARRPRVPPGTGKAPQSRRAHMRDKMGTESPAKPPNQAALAPTTCQNGVFAAFTPAQTVLSDRPTRPSRLRLAHPARPKNRRNPPHFRPFPTPMRNTLFPPRPI